MKKVTVITLHNVRNYGSVLQALATQHVFQELGVITEKGERLWSIVKDEFETLESTFGQVAKANHNLT